MLNAQLAPSVVEAAQFPIPNAHVPEAEPRGAQFPIPNSQFPMPNAQFPILYTLFKAAANYHQSSVIGQEPHFSMDLTVFPIHCRHFASNKR